MSLSADQLHNERDLLVRIAQGDEVAFRLIYNKYAGKVYGMAVTYLKSALNAQDIVQESFARVWQQRHKLVELDNFDHWLIAVTRNLLINQLEKIVVADSMRQRLHASDAGNGVNDYVDFKELEALLQKAVQQLPPRQREVYELNRNAGLSHQEIAAQLGISYDTTREHMSKALKNLRVVLEQNYSSFGLFAYILYAV